MILPTFDRLPVLFLVSLIVHLLPVGVLIGLQWPNFTIWLIVYGLAFGLPFLIICARHEVRKHRLRAIELFEQQILQPADADAAEHDPLARPGDVGILSFEFVKGKYYADLRKPRPGNPVPANDQGPGNRESAVPETPMSISADWMLLYSTLPFSLTAAFWLYVLLIPDKTALGQFPPPSLLTVGFAVGNDSALTDHVRTLTHAAVAFAGAYLYSVRLFLRALSAFDLTPLTFLRAFSHCLVSSVAVAVLFRAIPETELLKGAGIDHVINKPADLSLSWLILAFGFGFVPDSALNAVLERSRLLFKRQNTDVVDHVRVVPVTLIDGIDSNVAFRLEECGIHDVQNLATYNPVMLHVETTFGIYEAVDWIAQAQLCLCVRVETFLLLRSVGIRTIFDLERAMLSAHTPDGTVTAIGRLLVSDSISAAKLREAFTLRGPFPSDWDAARRAAEPEYPADRFFEDVLGGIRDNPDTVLHMVRCMVDDLHVRRLRQVWLHIATRLGAPSAQLADTKEPGLPCPK